MVCLCTGTDRPIIPSAASGLSLYWYRPTDHPICCQWSVSVLVQTDRSSHLLPVVCLCTGTDRPIIPSAASGLSLYWYRPTDHPICCQWSVSVAGTDRPIIPSAASGLSLYWYRPTDHPICCQWSVSVLVQTDRSSHLLPVVCLCSWHRPTDHPICCQWSVSVLVQTDRSSHLLPVVCLCSWHRPTDHPICCQWSVSVLVQTDRSSHLLPVVCLCSWHRPTDHPICCQWSVSVLVQTDRSSHLLPVVCLCTGTDRPIIPSAASGLSLYWYRPTDHPICCQWSVSVLVQTDRSSHLLPVVCLCTGTDRPIIPSAASGLSLYWYRPTDHPICCQWSVSVLVQTDRSSHLLPVVCLCTGTDRPIIPSAASGLSLYWYRPTDHPICCQWSVSVLVQTDRSSHLLPVVCLCSWHRPTDHPICCQWSVSVLVQTDRSSHLLPVVCLCSWHRPTDHPICCQWSVSVLVQTDRSSHLLPVVCLCTGTDRPIIPSAASGLSL